ncbi:hypothetical protein [Rhizobium etli]|uniref:hypothetical protein n=1 Tax=Rhizobium etli TaxID=29449 RepID=UPI00038391EE|nr:hypothetical protein [Rhizobium etli]AGS24498.1 hypothetical protein REMIM1_PC00144 [Rhizobium etli bv. mimosae str. Mim1]
MRFGLFSLERFLMLSKLIAMSPLQVMQRQCRTAANFFGVFVVGNLRIRPYCAEILRKS